MDFRQFIAKHILDPLFVFHENSKYDEYLEYFERSQYYPDDTLRTNQLFLMRRLLDHAYKNCPYYTRLFDEIRFDVSTFTDMTNLTQVPILTKKDIQSHLNELCAVNYSHDELVKNQTGGSTGAPLNFYLDYDRMYSRKASTFRHNRWTGWDIGVKTAVLWGHHRDFLGPQNWKSKIRNIHYDRNLVLDTSDISTEKLREFVEALNAFEPKIYLAYANSMYLYARFIKENNIKKFNRPESIITSAELLTAEQRELIEEVFDCKVFNRYGCREVSIISSECDQHDGMHISSETLYLEFIQDNKAVNPGEPGKIVITDLLNFGMPLIRYQIEDMGTPVEGKCDCGRTLPRMEITGGRVTDFLVTSDNRVVSGASMTIYFIATVKGIAQAQIIQKQKNELVLKIVKDDNFSTETEIIIQEKVTDFFGKTMKYRIEYTDRIPTTASGKYLFSISEIDPMEFLS